MDPYLAAGLQRNPFVAEDRPGVAAAVLTDVGVRPDPTAAVVELVGCKGAGKTTHLLAWLDGRGPYHHVDPGWHRWRRLPQPAAGGRAAWDEVDRVPRPLLARAVRRARRRDATLWLGTHVPTGLADQSLAMPAPSGSLVQRFADRRLTAAALPGRTPDLRVPDDTAVAIAAASGGCWWTVGTALHVWAAQAVTDPQAVSPPVGARP